MSPRGWHTEDGRPPKGGRPSKGERKAVLVRLRPEYLGLFTHVLCETRTQSEAVEQAIAALVDAEQGAGAGEAWVRGWRQVEQREG